MTKINKSDIFDLLRSVLISLLISVIGVIILALIAKFADLSDGVITGVNIAVRVIAILLGMLIGVRAGRYFIAKGTAAGCIWFLYRSLLIFLRMCWAGGISCA